MNSPRHTDLFVFGTLRDEDVLRLVLGRDLPMHCRRFARLPNHVRLLLHDEPYPVLTPLTGGSVPGAVLSLTARDIDRVTFFEAEEYVLEAARVSDVHGHMLDVVLCAEGATRPGPRRRWSLRQWQAEHKPTFLEHARVYMDLYGKRSAAQAERVWKRLAGRN